MNTESISDLLLDLATMSPLPADNDPRMTPEFVDHYADILRRLKEQSVATLRSRSREIIRCVMSSFGTGEGYGTFQEAVHLLEAIDLGVLHEEAREGLKSQNLGTVYWCLHMLSRFRDSDDVGAISEFVNHPDRGIKLGALVGLVCIGTKEAVEIASRFFDDDDPVIRLVLSQLRARAED